MSENFDNMNPNMDAENTTPAEPTPKQGPTPEPPKTAYTPPVSNPSSYKPPVYNADPQYASSNQYMPYGSYARKPEAPKKPSKGKKKGLIIAVIILCAIFLVSAAVLVCSFIYKAFTSEVPKDNGDNTQMELFDTPKNTTEESKTGEKLNSEEVYKKVYEASVGILVYSSNQQMVVSEGTGIVMGVSGDEKSTYIITCAHVIDVSNPRVVVQTHDGTQYDAVVVGRDSKTDIGLVRINTKGLKAAEFANSETVSVGNTVYAIGNPGGTQFFGSFTNGMVSAIGRPVDSPVGYEVSCIQHTAPINPGNSGGALVNEYGQVIGINSSKIASTDYEGMGFAVPSSTVKEIVDELIKNGRVTNRPVLGIKFMPALSSQSYSIIVKTNNLPAGSIIIDSIMNSDMKNKDVREGDMIIAVNGKDLETYETILDVVENGKVGDEIKLTICRIDSNYQISKFEVTTVLIEDTGELPAKEEPMTQSFPFSFE